MPSLHNSPELLDFKRSGDLKNQSNSMKCAPVPVFRIAAEYQLRRLAGGDIRSISYGEIADQPITGACDRTRQIGSPGTVGAARSLQITPDIGHAVSLPARLDKQPRQARLVHTDCGAQRR